MASKFIIELMKKASQKIAGQGKTTGKEGIKFIKPDIGKLKKVKDAKEKNTAITDKYAANYAKDNPELLKKFRKNSKESLKRISNIYKDSKKDGGRIGRKLGGGSDMGNTSVKKKNKGFAKLPESIQIKINKKLAKKV